MRGENKKYVWYPSLSPPSPYLTDDTVCDDHTDILISCFSSSFPFYYIQVGVMEPIQFQSSWLDGCGFWQTTKAKSWESGYNLLVFMWNPLTTVEERDLKGGVSTISFALRPWQSEKWATFLRIRPIDVKGWSCFTCWITSHTDTLSTSFPVGPNLFSNWAHQLQGCCIRI